MTVRKLEESVGIEAHTIEKRMTKGCVDIISEKILRRA